MDTTKKKIAVTARVRIIASIKKTELTRAENYDAVVEIDRWLINQPAAQNEAVATAIKQAFAEVFRARMRSDPMIRRGVGGTRWSVDLMHYKYKDAI